ncbi:hypothetical protein KGQ19_32060 [Catenulispora sp. NL8]|uniref:Lipoprotein n=1 Tax=Catenulispora pinistramenti TaxID=2705254 RepID=A0ABS5KZP2_9ACTN|nr:hypothetical protein [Catenulispora pinistramenti]MBS2551513.1 hypothetical protein [Catenulispora pinistramenti]
MLNSRRRGAIVVAPALVGLCFGLTACSSTGSTTTAAGANTSSTAAANAATSSAVISTSVASVSASPSTSTAPGAGNAPTGASNLKPFVGTWTGHTRTLTISADGIATEKVYDGCCTVAWTLRFSVDHASGSHADAALYTTLLSATFNENPDFPTPGSPEAQKGQGGIAGVQDGVLTEPYAGGTFCDAAADAAGKCGQ